MGRYASHSQEVLYREGQLVGFNAGFGFHSEHEWGYNGQEQIKPKKLIDKNRNHPFNGEIVENPEVIKMMEFSDGNVWITNDTFQYMSLMSLPEQERYKRMRNYINNEDKRQEGEILARLGVKPKAPEVVSLWDGGFTGFGDFNLISTSQQSSELLRKLYKEMQKKNVAISSDYSFIFKDRGLSFVILDKLTQEDLKNKQLVDHLDEMKRKFQKKYTKYLKKEGIHGESCIFDGCKYPAEFWSVQISDIKYNNKGEVIPEFYLEILDTSKGREDLDSLCMHKLCRLTGDEIKALVPIVKSSEYEEYAKSHSQEDVETYLVKELCLYRQRQVVDEGRNIDDKESLEAIATEQRIETVKKRAFSLKDRIGKWLHRDRENDKDKLEEKGV